MDPGAPPGSARPDLPPPPGLLGIVARTLPPSTSPLVAHRVGGRGDPNRRPDRGRPQDPRQPTGGDPPALRRRPLGRGAVVRARHLPPPPGAPRPGLRPRHWRRVRSPG